MQDNNMTEKKDRLPLVTISMPVFNGASSISNALDSIVAQTYPNLEIIVSDNASDDETFDICQRYEKKIRELYCNVRIVMLASMPIRDRSGSVLVGDIFCFPAAMIHGNQIL